MNDNERQRLLDQGAEAERKRIAEVCLDKARTASNRPRVRAYSELYDELVGAERSGGRMSLEQARVLFPPHTIVEYDVTDEHGQVRTLIRMVIDAPELADDIDDDDDAAATECVVVPIGYDDEGQMNVPAESLRVVDVVALRLELAQAREAAAQSEDLHLTLLHAAAAALDLDLSDPKAPPTFVLDRLRAAKFQNPVCKHEPFEFHAMGVATAIVFGIPHSPFGAVARSPFLPARSYAPGAVTIGNTHELYGCRHCGVIYASVALGARKLTEEEIQDPYRSGAAPGSSAPGWPPPPWKPAPGPGMPPMPPRTPKKDGEP